VRLALGMDPQSAAFTPSNDLWRLQNDMLRVQQVQSEHSERLARLERQREEDARVKSVWGTSSPFPSVLGGTPQQGWTSVDRSGILANLLSTTATSSE
jgi:ubiquitin carboxyl-terminal hydrolase 4/11